MRRTSFASASHVEGRHGNHAVFLTTCTIMRWFFITKFTPWSQHGCASRAITDIATRKVSHDIRHREVILPSEKTPSEKLLHTRIPHDEYGYRCRAKSPDLIWERSHVEAITRCGRLTATSASRVSCSATVVRSALPVPCRPLPTRHQHRPLALRRAPCCRGPCPCHRP